MSKHEEARLAFNDLLAFIHEGKPLENVDDTLIKIEHVITSCEKDVELNFRLLHEKSKVERERDILKQLHEKYQYVDLNRADEDISLNVIDDVYDEIINLEQELEDLRDDK